MIKLGYIKFMDGGVDMGVGAALIASAVIGAGATAYSANQQSKAADKQADAQKRLCASQASRPALVAPSAHHALNEIKPNQQTDPAIGVHPVFQQTRQWPAQRYYFQGPQRAAWAQWGQPKFPCQTDKSEGHQAANGHPTGQFNGLRA